jgi:murein DD-endopeptidase MepM/ murein hydrolase activator NlpD
MAILKHVDLSNTPFLRNTRFTQYLVEKNGLDQSGFKAWFFLPGMLFNARDTWWGEQGNRDRPHEGLDLCLYRDRDDKMLRIDEETKIPAIYDGVVVRIANDFLGQSIFMEHVLFHGDNTRLYAIYGHTKPVHRVRLGKTFKAGDIIATLAKTGKSKAHIFAHVHISLGCASQGVPYDALDWENISASTPLTFLDPLPVIGGRLGGDEAKPTC